jgi:hypothetical protein
MAPKKTRKLVQETMVEEPTQDLDVPSKAIREEEQEILRSKKTMTTVMTQFFFLSLFSPLDL